MSAFTDRTAFTYDGISSTTYGLFLAYSDNNDREVTVFNGDLNTLSSVNSIVSTFMGYSSIDNTKFEIQIFSENELTDANIKVIYKWLVGRNGFKKLRFGDDVYYYNCIITSCTRIIDGYSSSDGKLHNSFKLTVECDSPYQRYYTTQVATYTGNKDGTTQATTTLNNPSIIDDYIYPTLKITATSETYISFICGKEITLTGMAENEVITINCYNQIITSSVTPSGALSTFNNKWLRMSDGVNTIKYTGNATFELKYVPMLKMGG